MSDTTSSELALGISASAAHVRLSRLRDQVERSLGALLVARLGRRDCDELTAVLGDWDGRDIPDTTVDPAPPVPRIVGQDASPSQLGLRGCPVTRADVRVTLAADAPATAAVLSWNGAGGSGSMPMRGSGTTWSGSLGPFRERGRVQWSVTASNVAGSTTGPVDTIAVTSCTDPTFTR